jgi:hypothetical protein
VLRIEVDREELTEQLVPFFGNAARAGVACPQGLMVGVPRQQDVQVGGEYDDDDLTRACGGRHPRARCL